VRIVKKGSGFHGEEEAKERREGLFASTQCPLKADGLKIAVVGNEERQAPMFGIAVLSE
jgi:hypothetical protein